MIINIPEPNSFKNVANILIDSAWRNLMKLLRTHKEYKDVYEIDKSIVDSESLDSFFENRRVALGSSYAIVQQAVEFYIKSRISEVSPYLLIGKEPRNWPKSCNSKDVSFSEFRTIDAQDLVKVHDTVCEKRLDVKFSEVLRDMRVKRNILMHTFDESLTVKPEDLAIAILTVYEGFVGKGQWLNSRLLEDDPYEYLNVHEEFSLILELDCLTPAFIKRFFNYDKRKSALYCHHCYNIIERAEFYDSKWTDSLEPTVQAVVEKKGIYKCIICNNEFEFKEEKCPDCDRLAIIKKTNKCVWCEND